MFYLYESPVGALYLEGGRGVLTGIWFHDGRFSPKATEFCRSAEGFEPGIEWLTRYFNGEHPDPAEVNIKLYGSEFQKSVWGELKKIPYGGVTTYGAIAKALEATLGHRVAAQAVGGAVGRNPISILVPCHRVVGAGGKMVGYGGGLWRKEFLLELEKKNT